MRVDEELYSMYLEELHALENFRMSYAAAHASIPLQDEEPDIKRMLEAQAFFSARIRRTALNNLVSMWRRIFQQHYPFLLRPVPSMGIIRAVPGARCAETVVLPAGSEMTVRGGDGKVAGFRTLHELRILPVRLADCRLLARSRGLRLQLTFASFFPRSDDIGQLNLAINYLNNYYTSLRLMDALRKHLRRVSVSFEKHVQEDDRGITCEYRIGQPADLDESDLIHPIEKLRRFFHFPRNELFINIDVPTPPPNWERFTLLFDLDSSWPKNMTPNQETFQPFCTPVINLRTAAAQPIICNGKQSRYAIRPAELEQGFMLHSVRAVMRVTDSGLTPMQAGILGGGAGSYEVEHHPGAAGAAGGDWLLVDLPEAFEEEVTLVPECRWYQPWFSEHLIDRLEIRPYHRTTVGVAWELCGNFMPHLENTFQDDVNGLVQILALKSKTSFSHEDLRFLLKALGSVEKGAFRDVFRLLKNVRSSSSFVKRGGLSVPLNTYHLDFQEFDASLAPLIEVFRGKITDLLNAWSVDIEAEIV